jgi:hypothetical protein
LTHVFSIQKTAFQIRSFIDQASRLTPLPMFFSGRKMQLSDFARALGFRSILGGGAVPRHQALVSCP